MKGELAAYNGQWLIGDVTLGRLNRIFVEEVEGIWQGAVFLHSGGHDPEGRTGFTAGPNRIVEGPDGKYYIGHIGHGGLWQFLPAPGEAPKPHYGLQRLSFVEPDEIPATFNELVALRDIPGGIEAGFFRSIPAERRDNMKLSVKQWTYVPTKGYGGRNFATETLEVAATEWSADGKRLQLTLPGIRDNRPPFVTHQEYSNENVGWVVEISIQGLELYQDTGWYTMLRHQGGSAQRALAASIDPVVDPMTYARAQHEAVCAACHTVDGTRRVGPSFKGLFGRKQAVIRGDKKMEVQVDEAYLARAMDQPMAEAPVGYPPAMPALNLSATERDAMIAWIRSLAEAPAHP